MQGTTIVLVRGDTKPLQIDSILNDNGEPYTLKATDIIYMDVKKSLRDETPLIHKELTSANYNEQGCLTFQIDPADTAELEAGEYLWDMRLVTALNDVYTIIPKSKLLIVENVTDIPDDIEGVE